MKPVLYNKIDKKVLKQQIATDSCPRETYAFYRYVPLAEVETLRDTLYEEFSALGMLGRIYLAREGINAQFSLPTESKQAFETLTTRYACLEAIRLQQALEENAPSFHKLTIKVRKKLVADGLSSEVMEDISGEFLTPVEFEQVMDQKDSVVVDVRNHYEHEVGYFENAHRFPADTFRELLPVMADELKGKEARPILMYCTGGIRCEKASVFLRQHGFKRVYQLRGGIVGYAQDLRKRNAQASTQTPSKFKGKNFVFDNRLGEAVSPEILSTCHQCQSSCDVHTNCANEACHLLFIQCQECRKHFEGCCSIACQTQIALPVEEQRKQRRGKPKADALMIHKARASLSKIDKRELSQTL